MGRPLGVNNAGSATKYAVALPFIKLRWPPGAVARLSGVHRNVARRWSRMYWMLKSGRHMTTFQELSVRDRALIEQTMHALRQLSPTARRALATYLTDSLT